MSARSAAERAALHRLARQSIAHQLGLGPAPRPPDQGALGAPGAAFVELRVGGEPRGCLGRLRPGPHGLAAEVVELAAAAARSDPRVAALDPAALAGLRVRLWALGEARPLAGPEGLAPGRDGVAVERGWHRGLLLPGEALARGWDAPTFLRRACLAAGLPPSAWQEPGTRLTAFSAEELPDEEA